MLKFLPLLSVAALAAFLAGCGQSPDTTSLSLSDTPAVSAQSADLGMLAAQAAIRSQIAQAAPGLTVTLADLQIVPTPILGLYTFTALKTVGGHDMNTTYLVTGTYSFRDGKVAVSSSTLTK